MLAAARRVRDPQDREAVHDLRVAIRRLSEMLWLWKPVLGGTGSGRLRRRLCRMRRRLGPVREAEVHPILVRRLRLAPDDPERQALATLIERLERRRKTLRRSAARRAEQVGIARRLQRTQDGIRRVTVPEIARWEMEGRLEWRRARAVAALAAARDAGDPAHMHVARVALKRWRYAGESAVAVRGGRAKALDLVELAELQEALGAVQDLVMLQRLLQTEASDVPLTRVRERVSLRLERSRTAASRALASWLALRGGPRDTPAPAPPRRYRRTTRSRGGALSAGRARAARARRSAG